MPQRRLDRNGKAVTRHVRPVQPPVVSQALTAPPVSPRAIIVGQGRSLPAAKARNALGRGITANIFPHEVPHQRHHNKELSELVSTSPDALMEAYYGAATEVTGLERTMLSRLVIKALDGDTDPTDIESAIHFYVHGDSHYREMVDEYYEMGSKGLGAFPIGDVLKAIKNYRLDGFAFDPALPIGRQSEHTVLQCNALIDLHTMAENVATRQERRLEPDLEPDGTMKDRRLPQLVVDRPDAAPDVIAVMDDRDTLSYDLIEAILGSASSALREGTL